MQYHNLVTVALRRKRDALCPRDQSINAPDVWAEQFLQPATNAADTIKAAWQPVLPGQAVPMIGEEVGYVQPCDPV